MLDGEISETDEASQFEIGSVSSEIEQEEKAARRARGEGTDLYLLNLLTNERQFVTSTPEPLHYFKPVWISPTELEYTLPSGEKKIYTL